MVTGGEKVKRFQELLNSLECGIYITATRCARHRRPARDEQYMVIQPVLGQLDPPMHAADDIDVPHSGSPQSFPGRHTRSGLISMAR